MLTTHLLVERSPNRYTTACGRVGIPLTEKHSFGSSEDRLEGRRPASAGGGIVAVTAMAFLVPTRAVKYCARCTKAFEKGEGI